MKTSTKFILMGIILFMIITPLVFVKDGEFSGSDGKAQDLITVINPEYKPWFKSIFVSPSSEVESLLFSSQAALGAGVGCYILGYLKGKKVEKGKKVNVADR